MVWPFTSTLSTSEQKAAAVEGSSSSSWFSSSESSGNAKAMQWLGMREKGGRDEMFINPAVDSGILKQVADDSINLISIFGAARQGKSFLMNVLANKEELFKISNLKDPCTQGVDLSSHFLALENFSSLNGCPKVLGNIKVGFVDAEGQDDSRLVTPVLLSSKVVIFNWKDSLQADRMLNLLAVLARAAQGVECSSGSTKIFGHLHIVFRDWNFANSDPKEIYQDLFKAERGRSAEVSVRNQARSALVDAFESITVWLFPTPVENTADLSSKLKFEQLQTSFKIKLQEFRSSISRQLQTPMKFNDEVITGRRLRLLMPALVEVLNSDDVIMPEPIFISMIRAEAESIGQQYQSDVRRQCQDVLENEPSLTPEEVDTLLQKKISTITNLAQAELESMPTDIAATVLRSLDSFIRGETSACISAVEKRLQDQARLLFDDAIQHLTDEIDALQAQLPMDVFSLQQSHAECVTRVTEVLNLLPKAPTVCDALERILDHASIALEKLLLMNEKRLKESKSIVLDQLIQAKQFIKTSIVSFYDECVAARQAPFSESVIEDKLQSVARLAESKFALAEPLASTYAEFFQTDLETYVDEMEEEIFRRYEHHVHTIVTKLNTKANHRLENRIREEISVLSPVSSDQLRAQIDKIIEEVKVWAAGELNGWSVPTEDTTALGESLDATGEMLYSHYFDKNAALHKEQEEKSYLEFYDQAKQHVEESMGSLQKNQSPIEDKELEQRFARVCDDVARSMHQAMTEQGLRNRIDVVTLSQRLSHDTKQCLVNAKLLNQSEFEKLRALKKAEEEMFKRQQHMEEVEKNRKEMEAMKNHFLSTISEKDGSSATLATELQLQAEKTRRLEEELHRVKLQALQHERKVDEMNEIVLRERQRRTLAEEAAQEAACAAEEAAQAALEAAHIESNQLLGLELKKKKKEEEDTKPILSSSVRRSRRRASGTTPEESHQRSRSASRPMVSSATRNGSDVENEESPLKKQRVGSQSTLHVEGVEKGETPVASDRKMSLAEAREAAKRELQQRVEARIQSPSVKKSAETMNQSPVAGTPSKSCKSPAVVSVPPPKTTARSQKRMSLSEAREAAQREVQLRIEARASKLTKH